MAWCHALKTDRETSMFHARGSFICRWARNLTTCINATKAVTERFDDNQFFKSNMFLNEGIEVNLW